ncbi:ABC-type transport auxiliary lipoprotein family protein [Sphingobium sp. AN558]|uniref:ABC-type transport auxiliary lipoprotein family protein n=1 Tax=Sphingobium sp. AN558 TaxID=3133442 RepID=UPI0030C14DB9
MKHIWLMILLALPGCAALKGGDQPVTMRLSPHFGIATVRPSPAPSLVVAPVQARGMTGALRYAYVDAAAPGEIRQAATLFWEEPPPAVLARALVAGLRGRFATVAGPDLALAADRRVVAVLDRFEEETGGGAARAIVAFDVTQVAQGKAIWAGRYCATRPIGSASGSVRATAFREAVEQAVAAFVQDAATGAVTPAPC